MTWRNDTSRRVLLCASGISSSFFPDTGLPDADFPRIATREQQIRTFIVPRKIEGALKLGVDHERARPILGGPNADHAIGPGGCKSSSRRIPIHRLGASRVGDNRLSFAFFCGIPELDHPIAAGRKEASPVTTPLEVFQPALVSFPLPNGLLAAVIPNQAIAEIIANGQLLIRRVPSSAPCELHDHVGKLLLGRYVPNDVTIRLR